MEGGSRDEVGGRRKGGCWRKSGSSHLSLVHPAAGEASDLDWKAQSCYETGRGNEFWANSTVAESPTTEDKAVRGPHRMGSLSEAQ